MNHDFETLHEVEEGLLARLEEVNSKMGKVSMGIVYSQPRNSVSTSWQKMYILCTIPRYTYDSIFHGIFEV